MTGIIILVLLMWEWMGLLSKKNDPWRYCGYLSRLIWTGALTWSLLLKLSPWKLKPWIVLHEKFLSPEFVFSFFFKSEMGRCIEHCFHICVCFRTVAQEILDMLKKRVYGIVGPSLTVSLKRFPRRQNVASLSLFLSKLIW